VRFAIPERDPEDRRDRERADDDRVGPAGARRLDDRVDEGGDRTDREERTGEVEAGLRRVPALGHEDEAEAEGQQGDRDVEEEDGAPREVLDQEAADERAEADPEAGHAGPDRDRLRPLFARKHVGDDRERARHDQGATDAHRDTGEDQVDRFGRKGRRDRRDGEDDQPDLEGAGPSEPVAERAHRQEQPGEDEDVGVDHPLELGGRGPECPLERRQGDVQDGVVEADDDEAEGQDAEDRPAAGVDPRVDRRIGNGHLGVSWDGAVAAGRRLHYDTVR
jgi:hypothetical protein